MWLKNRMLLASVTLGVALLLGGCGENADPGNVPGEISDTTEIRDMADTGETETDENAGTDESAGTDGSSEVQQSQETEQTGQYEARGYYFAVNETAASVDMDIEELLPQLAEAKSVFEAPSCAGEGVDYIYNFSAYEIETYPAADGKNRIGFITLKDDTVATAEGIDLSMTKEDVIRVYGEDYEESPNQITYEKDGTKLNFIFQEDNIISIEYVSAVVG